MLKLLKIELKKLLPYRTFRVLMVLYLLIVIFAIVGGITFQFVSFRQPVDYVYGFPRIWYHAIALCSILNTALAVIVIMITCNEFTYRTGRQHIIDGQDKGDLVLGKVLLMAAISVMLTVVVTISGLISGMMYSGSYSVDDIFERIWFVPGFMLQAFCLMSVAYLFAVLFKKTGLAVLLFLIYTFPVEILIRKMVTGDGIGDYFPIYTFYIKLNEIYWNSLFPIPELHVPAYSPSIENAVWSIGYAGLFILIAFGVLKKRDM